MKIKSLFFKLFLILILFITVPVILISSIINYQMTKYSFEAIGKSAISKLKASDKLTELMSDSLARRALEMTKDDVMDGLIGLGTYNEVVADPEKMMKLTDMQTRLANLASTISSIHSVYLYIDYSDFVMTSLGTRDINHFADLDWLIYYEKFRSNHAVSNWTLTRTVPYSSNPEENTNEPNKVITFFYTFTPYTTSVRGVLVFNLYESAVRALANNDSSLDEGYVEIINSNGDVISDMNGERIGKNISDVPYIRKITKSLANEGYLLDRSGAEKLLISYHKSEFNKWIYLGIYKADSLMSKSNRIRTYILSIGLALILAGILLSYYASKRIYSPLNNLLRDIREKKGIDIMSNDSEMGILAKAYDNLLKDRERLSFIAEHKERNKTVYLENLLKGEKVEYLDKELTGIDLSLDRFICSVIQIDRFSEFESVYSREQQEYMRMFILKISEELINTEWNCAGMIFEKGRIALIVNYDASREENVKGRLRDIFEKIQAETGKITDNTISVGIGTSQDCVEGICESFDKALEALRFKLIYGYGSIQFWEDIKRENTSYYYPFVQEKYIFNILNAGIKDKLAPVIAEFVQEIKNNRDIHYDNITQIFNQLIGNTIKYLLDCHCNVGMIFGDNYSLYHVLASKENLEEIRQWLTEVYTRIADFLDKEWSLSKNHFERALEYIHKNYRREIDINEVAKYAGISYSHLRKIFREEAGENILNYINGLRIQESKRLLRMSDMMIKDISAYVGYNSDKSFVRFFKKYEGVGPGDFRASVRQEQSMAAKL